MASCVFTYNEKNYSEQEFKNLLANGLLETLEGARQLKTKDRLPVTVSNKEDVEQVMKDIFLLEPEMANAVAGIYDAMGNAWVKDAGEGATKEDYYKTMGFDRAMLEDLSKKSGFLLQDPFVRMSIAIGYAFKENTGKVARELYDIKNLKMLSIKGSDRDVYDLENGKVLKIAKHPRGLMQNMHEGYAELVEQNLLPKVYERGLNYVVVDKAEKLDIIKHKWLLDKLSAMYNNINELHDAYANNDLDRVDKTTASLIEQLIGASFGTYSEYDILWGDIVKEDSWGVDSKGNVMLVDAGVLAGPAAFEKFDGVNTLDDAEFVKIKTRSDAAAAKYGDVLTLPRTLMYQNSQLDRTINYFKLQPKQVGVNITGYTTKADKPTPEFINRIHTWLQEQKINDIGVRLDMTHKVIKFYPKPNQNNLLFQDNFERLFDAAFILADMDTSKLSGNLKFVDLISALHKTNEWIDKYVGFRKYYNIVTDIETMIGTYGKVKNEEGYTQSESVLQELLKLAKTYLNESSLYNQGPKAAIQLGDTFDIIYALTNPNVSSPIHELAHKWERNLTKDERKIVMDWAEDKKWTRETSEKFARGFEKYLAEGKAPFPELQAIFEKFKEWLTQIYNGITGSDIDVELNDTMRQVYARMLGAEAKQAIKEKVTRPLQFLVPNPKAKNYIPHKMAITSFYKKGGYEEALQNYEIQPDEVRAILKQLGYNTIQIEAVIWRGDADNLASLQDISTWAAVPLEMNDYAFMAAVDQAEKTGLLEEAIVNDMIDPATVKDINEYLKKHNNSLDGLTMLTANQKIAENIELDDNQLEVAEQLINEEIQKEEQNEEERQEEGLLEETPSEETQEEPKQEPTEERAPVEVRPKPIRKTVNKKEAVKQDKEEKELEVRERASDKFKKSVTYGNVYAEDIIKFFKTKLKINKSNGDKPYLLSYWVDETYASTPKAERFNEMFKDFSEKNKNDEDVVNFEDIYAEASAELYNMLSTTVSNPTEFEVAFRDMIELSDLVDKVDTLITYEGLDSAKQNIDKAATKKEEKVKELKQKAIAAEKAADEEKVKRQTLAEQEAETTKEPIEKDLINEFDEIEFVKGDDVKFENKKYQIEDISVTGRVTLTPIYPNGNHGFVSKNEAEFVYTIESKLKKVPKPRTYQEHLVGIAERMQQIFPNIPFEIGNFKGDFIGRFYQGKVYINNRTADAETPIHEFLHPFVYILDKDNPTLYNNLMDELQSVKLGQTIINEVKSDKSYNDLDEKEQMNEALTRYLSKLIKEVFDTNGKIIAEKLEEKRQTLKDFISYWWNKLRDFIFGEKTGATLDSFVKKLQDSELGSKYKFNIIDTLKDDKVFTLDQNGVKNIFFNKSKFKKDKAGRASLIDTTPEILFEPIKDDLDVESKEFVKTKLADYTQSTTSTNSLTDDEKTVLFDFKDSALEIEDIKPDMVVEVKNKKGEVVNKGVFIRFSVEGGRDTYVIVPEGKKDEKKYMYNFVTLHDTLDNHIFAKYYPVGDKIQTTYAYDRIEFKNKISNEIEGYLYDYKLPNGNKKYTFLDLKNQIYENYNSKDTAINSFLDIRSTEVSVNDYNKLITVASNEAKGRNNIKATVSEYTQINYQPDNNKLIFKKPKLGSKVSSEKTISNVTQDNLASYVGETHAALINDEIKKGIFSEANTTVNGQPIIIKYITIPINHKALTAEGLSDREKGKMYISSFPANMGLQGLADFIITMENVAYSTEGHDAAFKKMDLFLKAASINKVDVKSWMEREAKKAKVMKDTGERRVAGGSGFLINEAKDILENIFDRYEKKEIDEATAVLEYIRGAMVALRQANSILRTEVQTKLGKTLTPLEVKEMNTKFFEISTLYSHYASIGTLINKHSDLIRLDEKNKFKLVIAEVATLKAEMNGMALSLVTEWLYPKYEQQMRGFEKSENFKEGDILTKDDFKNKLKSGDEDSSIFTYWMGATINTRDPIAAISKLAMVDAIQENHRKDDETMYKINVAYSNFLSSKGIANERKALEEYYKANYMRKAFSYEQVDYDETKKEIIYDFVERWAFHTEYLDDVRAKERIEYYKSKVSQANSADRSALMDMWDKKNPLSSPKYKNSKFDALKSDSYFNLLYTNYKDSNDKFGERKLKFGIIPQAKKNNVWVSDLKKRVTTLKDKIKNSKKSTGNSFKDIIYNAKEKGIVIADELLGADYYDRSLINLTNTEYYNIRTSFVMPIEESDLDFTLNETIVAFSADANSYYTLRSNQSSAENLKLLIQGNPSLNINARTIVKKNKGEIIWDSVYKMPKVKRGIDAKVNKQIIQDLNDIFYGESEFQSDNIGPININLNKLANKVGFFTAINNMTLNIPAFFRNMGIGNINNLGAAIGGRYWTPTDWKNGLAEYNKSLLRGDFFKDMATVRKSKITQMAMRYDAIQGEYRDDLGRKVVGGFTDKLYSKGSLFFLQHAAEHQIQITGMLSLMKNTKVDIIKNGKTVDQVSLFDAYVEDKDGTYKLRGDVMWTQEQDLRFTNRLHNISRELNGNYSPLHKSVAQRYALGKLMLQYRKYMYEQFRARYGSRRLDYELGDVKVGYYRRFFKKLTEEFKDGYFTNFTKNYNNEWTTVDKDAVKKTAYEFAVIAGTAVLAVMIASMEDDDDDDLIQDYSLLLLVGAYSDMSMYSFNIGPEMYRQFNNPTASLFTIKKSMDVMFQLFTSPGEEYDQSGFGYEAGENKLLVKSRKLIPIYNQLHRAMSPEQVLKFYALTKKTPLDSKDETSFTERIVEGMFKADN
jgi:hypothetical protein